MKADLADLIVLVLQPAQELGNAIALQPKSTSYAKVRTKNPHCSAKGICARPHLADGVDD
jgi:hypothetical protein